MTKYKDFELKVKKSYSDPTNASGIMSSWSKVIENRIYK